jgi:hypothetical protein
MHVAVRTYGVHVYTRMRACVLYVRVRAFVCVYVCVRACVCVSPCDTFTNDGVNIYDIYSRCEADAIIVYNSKPIGSPMCLLLHVAQSNILV